MRRGIQPALVACLGLASCGEPTDIIVPEPEVHSMQAISLGGFSFAFPAGLDWEGDAEACPDRASECPLGDDSTHAIWRSGSLRFDYVLDPYGTVPMRDDWGEAITINDKPAFRKHLDDGGKSYLVTNYFGGPDTAAVAVWKEPEEPIFWGTCYEGDDCDAVLQTLASVRMRSARQECAIMVPGPPPEFVPPPGYCEDCSIPPPPPAPRTAPELLRSPVPPAPPAPRPRNAPDISKDFRDDV